MYMSTQTITSETVPQPKVPRPDSPKILCLKLLNIRDQKCQMAKDLRDTTKLNEGDIKPVETRSLVDITLDCVTGKSSKDLLVGTVSGWLGGWALVRVGRVAAFGLGGGVILLHFASECGYINVNWEKVKEATHRSQEVMERVVRFIKVHSCYSVGFLEKSRPPSTSLIQDQDNLKPEIFKADEPMVIDSHFLPHNLNPKISPAPFLPQTPLPLTPKTSIDGPFLPQKPGPQSKISISPNSIPNPNPSISTSKLEYPNYGGYLCSVPGYSAFQPVSVNYPRMGENVIMTEERNTDKGYSVNPIEKCVEKLPKIEAVDSNIMQIDDKTQTDFEEQFTPEVVQAVTTEINRNLTNDPKINLNSTVSVNTQTQTPSNTKKRTTERFSLKTSIPISKIDMKCVNSQEALYHTSKIPFNAIQNSKNEMNKVEIQSNVVIKSSMKKDTRNDGAVSSGSNNINALINAAEAIHKNDMFRRPDPKTEVIHEVKDPPPVIQPQVRQMLDSNNIVESNSEHKNQLLFIQSKTQPNPKMLLINQNPQVLLQRTNFESKNLPAPSRLSSQKRNKDDVIENQSSKVVALKRLHQENCDENDFENLITENQIYGNKIVVKDKSQNIHQQQDLRMKELKKLDYKNQETKNVVLQPNFLYLSNLQFPNLMMIKNNTNIVQNNELNINRPKIVTNDSKIVSEASTMTAQNQDVTKIANVQTNKDFLFKPNNKVLQPLSNRHSKNDLVIQTSHQKVIMNPQIVYQVPVIVDKESKINQNVKEYPKYLGNNKDYKPIKQQSNDKLYIACPYQMDSKLKPKIVITNIRPKVTKVEEISTLDLYEKRKKLKRLKHLTNNAKDGSKVEIKKTADRIDNTKNIITPNKMNEEIAKEFANTKIKIDDTCSESDSDYEKDDIDDYESIIKEFEANNAIFDGKSEFLANFRLASLDDYKDKQMERQERALKRDAVATAYIAAGRIDKLYEDTQTHIKPQGKVEKEQSIQKYEEQENGMAMHKKMMFLSQLKLAQVSTEYREDYERTWKEIVKERKRRNGEINILTKPKVASNNIDFDTNNQLQMLTEIKRSVNENNNLIMKRFDSGDESQLGDSISVLAEKNFTELTRLSIMADRSMKLITGHEKRDLNPGFDSENIQPTRNYEPYINIPNISKIITLKSQETMTSTMTSQATSMDEPRCSAAGATETRDDNVDERTKDVAIQAEYTWPGMDVIKKSFKEYDRALRKEIADLYRRTTQLQVEGAQITRNASRDSDQARALLAERRHLLAEEGTTRALLTKLCNAIRVIRGYN